MRLKLRKAVLNVAGVHSRDLLLAWRAKDLNNLHQLINAAVAWEKGLAQQKLSHHAPRGPDVDAQCVVGRTKNEFRRAVIA